MAKILVVDDEILILDACRQILEKENYETDVSLTISRAKEKLREDKYDLVITDLRLPGENGFDLLKEIKANYPDTGVVVMTGYAEIKNAVECIRAGADDYLPKPFEMKELLNIIKKFFETRNLKAEVARLRNLGAMKSKSLSNVTHELRSPLTAIKAAADLYEKIKKQSARRKLVKIVKNNTARMLVLVKDLLDVTEIEKDEIKLAKTETDIHRGLFNAVAAVKNKAEEKNIAIKYKKGPPVFIFYDEVRMEQVFINLLDNAVKFSPEGSSIKISVAGLPGGGCKIVFSDSGPGISGKEQLRVFDRFYQTGTTLAHKTKGFGLGLSIVKKLVEMHGGSVKVNPRKKEKGSKFTVILPQIAKSAVSIQRHNHKTKK